MALTETDKILLVAILSVVAAVVMYFEWRFVRSRKFGQKVAESRTKKDRAFNALLTTKAVRNKLRSQNMNTLKADYIIQRAQDSQESGDYDSCIETCTRAREELLKCKQEGNVNPEPSRTEELIDAIDEDESIGRERKLKMPPIPKDDASLPAKFELNAARGDLDLFTGPAATREAAAKLVADAEKHFETKDYTRALSCSFKARKLLSGEAEEEKAEHVEKIGLPKQTPAKQNICSSCGSLVEPDDVFCASCGSPVGEKKCSSCGTRLKSTDKFCRKCGAKS